MKKNKSKYLNFPIQLLREGFIDFSKIIQNVITYSVIDYMERNELLGQKDFEKALKTLNITCNSSYQESMEYYSQVNDSLEKRVTASIKKEQLSEFRDNEKSELEIASFLAFVAFKSILGKKTQTKTNNSLIMARMMGFSAAKNISLTNDEEFFYEKYQKRYHIDKLKNELRTNWNLKIYGVGVKGFYFSFELDYEKLMIYAEDKRDSNKQKLRIQEEKEIRKRVLESRKSSNIQDSITAS